MTSGASQSISQLCFPSSTTKKWWSKETIAIVTGANKGIGFALVKQFACLGITVVLTARDKAKGMHAVDSLHESYGLKVDFHILDVANTLSIMDFASWFKDKYGVWDILVNNAAVSFNDVNDNGVEHAETVIKTNFYGPKLLIEALLPLSCSHNSSCVISRILNVSSRLGLPNKLKNQKVKMMLMDEENLSETKIEEMAEEFLRDVKSGRYKSQGWPEIWPDYAVSKLALNAYSKILAKRYKENGLSVNCFCPGFTQTSMTRGKGKHTVDSAAEIGVKLALLPPQELPTGKFFIRGTPHVYSKL